MRLRIIHSGNEALEKISLLDKKPTIRQEFENRFKSEDYETIIVNVKQSIGKYRVLDEHRNLAEA